jgi:hypothetical protein
MIERHYGTLLDGAQARIAERLDALEAQLGQADDARDERCRVTAAEVGLLGRLRDNRAHTRRSNVRRVAVVLLASVAVVIPTGCGGSSDSASSGEPPLTGIGATRDDFAKGKEPIPGPQVGCCFGPDQPGPWERYYGVEYDEKDRVISYGMSFTPTIRVADAQNVILGELPPDAKLVATAKSVDCTAMQYRSAQYRHQTGRPRNIDVWLYNGDDRPDGDVRIFLIDLYGAAKPGDINDSPC